MKLVILMYLDEDDACVARLMKRTNVPVYSRLPLEGHGAGAPGWYGETAPYRSRLLMTIVPEDLATTLLREVSECTGVQDSRHPIRAAALDVEEFVSCEGTRS